MAKSTSGGAPAAPGGTSYDGYFYRNNLQSTGTLPAADPYNLSPDIIRSSEPIPSPQSALTTSASLATLYDCAPEPGQQNYYYLRALNGGTDDSATSLSLFSAPAQLILAPESWTALNTESGGSTVSASAAPGHYAVGDEPFVWTPPPLPSSNGFYTFIAQAGSDTPDLSSWYDLAEMMAQQLNFAVHNVEQVTGNQSWERAIGLAIPAAFSATTLALTVTANGFQGCRLGLIASSFTSSGKPVMLNPVQLSNDFVTGFQFQGNPGYDATLYVQCWVGNTPVAAGSTISLELTCNVSEDMLEEAARRNLLDSRLANRVAQALGAQVTPSQVMPVGSATFLVGEATR